MWYLKCILVYICSEPPIVLLPCYKSCVEAPVAECLFLSTLAPAGCVWVELTSLTKSPPPYASLRLPSIKLANLQFSLSCIVLLFFSGALDSLRLKCCVGFNPGDIRLRDARGCHYPCGESHDHPAAERGSPLQPG